MKLQLKFLIMAVVGPFRHNKDHKDNDMFLLGWLCSWSFMESFPFYKSTHTSYC